MRLLYDLNEYVTDEYYNFYMERYKIFRPRGYEYEDVEVINPVSNFKMNLWQYKAKHGWFKKRKPDDEEVIFYDRRKNKFYKSDPTKPYGTIKIKDGAYEEVVVTRSDEYLRNRSEYEDGQQGGKKTRKIKARRRTKKSKKHNKSKKRRN
jgi:hypothetical protein